MKTNTGAAMLISVVFFLFISLAIIAGLVGPSVREFKISGDLVRSRQSFFLAESGVEDAYYRLSNAKPIGASTNITLNGSTATTTITDSGYNEKTISSSGDVASRQRKNQLVLSTGTGIAFSYGIQAGTGGFQLGNATVVGNVYSNGNITGSNGAEITGSAFAAGAGTINNIDIGQSGTGNAWARTVTNSTIQGTLYCQTGSGNNKSCNTSQGDAPAVGMPLTDEMITNWKADAALGGTISGNYTFTGGGSFGPKKINGNLTINSNMTITGTIHVTGNVTTSNGVHVSLSPSYGTSGGIIIIDGTADFSNNADFTGSGSANSFVMVVVTSTCPTGCAGSPNAVEVDNNVGAVIINAQNGTVHLNNNAELNEVVGKTIIIDNSAEVNYLSGLANTSFSSGPSGGWNVKTWKEIR